MSYSVAVQSSEGAAAGVDCSSRAGGGVVSATTIDCTWAQKRLNGLNHKKSSIFTGSRKIAKNQGKFTLVIKESSVAGLAGM